jgi:hypothetical protein
MNIGHGKRGALKQNSADCEKKFSQWLKSAKICSIIGNLIPQGKGAKY